MSEDEVKALQDELEALKAEKETLAGELEMAVAEKDKKLGSLNDSLSQAVTKYKAVVIKSNPEVPDELISGDTIEAIEQSVENAKTLIGRVRQRLEAETAATKVPAGAPQRTPIDLGALSPREKIQYAIGGKQ